MDNSFMVDRLPIKNWAKTLTEDLQLIDQLCEFPIQIAHPRFVLNGTQWLITGIKSAGSATGRRYVDFTVQIPLDESVIKYVVIRIFSPKLPRVEAFSDYLDRTINGGQFLCTLKENDQLILVAHFIRTINEHNSRKSNPICVLPEKSSAFADVDRELRSSNYSNESLECLTEEDIMQLFV